jgi:hypothetical protein
MNDQPDPLILVGGALTIQNLVKRYASLKGWERMQEIVPPLDGKMAGWSRRTAQAILGMTKPGDRILIFLPSNLYQRWLKTLEGSKRFTDIPLINLSLAQQIMTLHRWIAALESRPRSQSRLVRLLKKYKFVFRFCNKSHRGKSPVFLQD